LRRPKVGNIKLISETFPPKMKKEAKGASIRYGRLAGIIMGWGNGGQYEQ